MHKTGAGIMNIPFTIDQFLTVFENYNMSVWPVQIVFNLLALLMILFTIKKRKITDKINAGILAFFWIWIGIVYHWIFFTPINKAAYVFGLLFILQGLIFIFGGLIKKQIAFNLNFSIYSVTGGVFIFYALIIYPLLGHYLGHVYPASPTFGLPCPTTIFTFGILLFTDKKLPKYVLIIPFLWSIIGFSAALNLSIFEDFGLGFAGISGVIMRAGPE
jgi:hypothetical protein